MDFVTVLLAIGATARLTRLITIDTFPPAQGFRDWAVRRFGDEHWFPELVFCPWCVGFWVALVVGTTGYLFGDHLAWQAPAAILSLAFVASALVVRADA